MIGLGHWLTYVITANLRWAAPRLEIDKATNKIRLLQPAARCCSGARFHRPNLTPAPLGHDISNPEFGRSLFAEPPVLFLNLF
jgi:hypothetical protein